MSLKQIYDKMYLEILKEDPSTISQLSDEYNSQTVLERIKKDDQYKKIFKLSYHKKLENIKVLNKLKAIFNDGFLHKNIAELLWDYKLYIQITGSFPNGLIQKLDKLIMYLNSGNTLELLNLVEDIFNIACSTEEKEEYSLIKILKDISTIL